MKTTGLALLALAVVAHGDVLSDFFPFLGSPDPAYEDPARKSAVRESDSGLAPFSPADSDFGVQQVLGDATIAPTFHLLGSISANVTDNAPGATRALDDSSWYANLLLGAIWEPRLPAGWTGDVGVTQEFYEFERDQAIDFQNLTVRAGVVKNLVDLGDTIFYARYEYQRLVTGSWSEGDYSAQRIRTGLRKVLFLGSHHQLLGGVSAALDLDANPELLERNEFALDLAYTWWLTRDLGATLSWRGSYWDFDNGGREDWNHTVGLRFDWQTCPASTLFAHVYYSNHDSNTPLGVNDSESWHSGIGLGVQLAF
ncbi:hypothetical protein [Haloferula sargassicola]|uniref:Uncharacterized protein n=1 Tax=Haloferula sargassicola TaxID=490096 RepID=A0ABP9UTT8_9BACT